MKACLGIPIYDHGETIGAVVESLASLKLPCIIVDDGCGESTRTVLDRLEARHSWLDVIHHRDLSNWIAQHFGIRHESPQALVVRNGRDVWATSHSGITAAALRKQVTPSGESPE